MAARPERAPGLVYIFPGIEGGAWSVSWAMRGFRDARVRAELRVFDWQRPFNALANLTDLAGNLQRAGVVAAEIAAYARTSPEAAIDLVGYSGGGGMAVLVAEQLPPETRLRNVVLVQGALSPGYDLTRALAHIHGHLVNFYCPSDWLILGLGTETFGTIDRENVASAGKEGFDLARAVPDEALRPKVIQHSWNAEMLQTGHIGNHMCIALYAWNKRYVAPYLLAGGDPPPTTNH